MAAAVRTPGAMWALVRDTVRRPLFSSGHAMIVNAALTAAVGLAFWLVVARLYPPAVVGVNAAAVSAVMFLAGVAQLNLMSALLRFVPTAGRHTARMIATSYVLGAASSAVGAVVFLIGLRWWSPDLAPIVEGAAAAAWFVVATAIWAVFVMQDPVLLAVGRSWFVPAENMAFSLLKLIAVVVVVVALPSTGIFIAWTGSAAVAVAATTVFLFARAVPRHARASAGPDGERVGAREFVRFTGPDYIGALLWVAATALMPVLVLGLDGPTSAAAFSMAWTITLALYQVPTGMGQSLVVHGSAEQDRVAAHHRDLLRHTLALLVPAVVVLVALAPWLLRLFGAVYAEQATTTLRLLALSAIPQAVTSLAVSRGRVERRMGFVVAVLAVLCSLVLLLAIVLLPVIGLAAVGLAWLAGQTVVALVLVAIPGGGVRTRSARGAVGAPASVHGTR